MKEQISALREQMIKRDIDAYIVTTTDAHNSEYVSDHDMVLKYMSGFGGSNGTLLVTQDEALLWTDGRYYIQCEREIAGTGIKMMRQGDDRDPSVEAYIGEHIKDGGTLGFDGRCITKHMADRYLSKCKRKKVKTSVAEDIAGKLWDASGERPAAVYGEIKDHDIKYAGVSSPDKLKSVWEAVKAADCRYLYLSKPDDIMWLYNLRGNDVTYNPVALSYAFIDAKDRKSVLFLHKDGLKISAGERLVSEGVEIRSYEDIDGFLSEYVYDGSVMLDIREASVKEYDIIAGRLSGEYCITDKTNPTTELKAVKNDTEIKWMKEYFLHDSAAVTVYLNTVKSIMGVCGSERETELCKKLTDKGIVSLPEDMEHYEHDFDEVKAGKLCDSIRLSVKDCFDLSFTTIAAYGPNAAMMHYEATEDSYVRVENKGMLLTDCGGQYPGATTDVTRTISVGEVSDEEKKHFTLVLKGWLALMHATWIEGCTGRNLDILARQYLWNEGIDYKCGTGHGVGYCLGVHEGPQSLKWKYIPDSYEAELKPGMTITNEPGVYVGDSHGIRTENTMLVVERFTSDGDRYLGFENLTWVPIDYSLIDFSLLDDREKKWLCEYQDEVMEKLSKL